MVSSMLRGAVTGELLKGAVFLDFESIIDPIS